MSDTKTLHDKQKDENQLVLEYLQVRRALGLLGFFLPLSLIVYATLPGRRMQPSISEFYYTHMGDVFVGAMVAIGVFLVSYKGYSRDREKGEWLSDRLLTRVAGAGAIGVALFPVAVEFPVDGVPTSLCRIPLFNLGFECHPNLVHFGFALVFFVALALMSIFQFTRNDQITGNRIVWSGDTVTHVGCGIGMILCLIAIGLFKFLPGWNAALAPWNFMFWAESVAVVLFATSWLVKGKALEPPARMFRQFRARLAVGGPNPR